MANGVLLGDLTETEITDLEQSLLMMGVLRPVGTSREPVTTDLTAAAQAIPLVWRGTVPIDTDIPATEAGLWFAVIGTGDITSSYWALKLTAAGSISTLLDDASRGSYLGTNYVWLQPNTIAGLQTHFETNTFDPNAVYWFLNSATQKMEIYTQPSQYVGQGLKYFKMREALLKSDIHTIFHRTFDADAIRNNAADVTINHAAGIRYNMDISEDGLIADFLRDLPDDEDIAIRVLHESTEWVGVIKSKVHPPGDYTNATLGIDFSTIGNTFANGDRLEIEIEYVHTSALADKVNALGLETLWSSTAGITVATGVNRALDTGKKFSDYEIIYAIISFYNTGHRATFSIPRTWFASSDLSQWLCASQNDWHMEIKHANDTHFILHAAAGGGGWQKLHILAGLKL